MMSIFHGDSHSRNHLLILIGFILTVSILECDSSTTDLFDIKSLSGEPNYKSVNLTWEIEDIEYVNNNDTNSLPAKSFSIFYCELQSWGPNRCKSKLIEDNEIHDPNEPNKQYSTMIENLKMATKYSFHVRPRPTEQKASGRADLNGNELDESTFKGPTIIIPTKGFSAQATKCLHDASEIEVHTGPYFGGKILAEGHDDCRIEGNATSPLDTYVMRIDHTKCGSKVHHDTLTVETFITVQENHGIFTHSTRRFVVVCTYQPDTLTVRASFSVPGKGELVAPPSAWDQTENPRNGRYRKFNLVGRNALITKSNNPDDIEDMEGIVQEIDPLRDSKQLDLENEIDTGKSSFARLTDERFLTGESNHSAVRNDMRSGYSSLLIALALSMMMIGALIYIMQRELKKQQSNRDFHNLDKTVP